MGIEKGGKVDVGGPMNQKKEHPDKDIRLCRKKELNGQ